MNPRAIETFGLPPSVESEIVEALEGFEVRLCPASHEVLATTAVMDVSACAALVWNDDACATAAVMALRGEDHTARLPIIALAKRTTRDAFIEALATGADDLVDMNHLDGLASRLRGILSGKPRKTEGNVIVVSGDAAWSRDVARVFAQSSYDACLLDRLSEIPFASARSNPHLVIVGPDLAPGSWTSPRGVAPWIIVTAESFLCGTDRVARVSPTMPLSAIVSAAKDLLFGAQARKRGAERVPWTATVAFRFAGGAVDQIGVCDDVSTGGLAVRTLAPISAGSEVWLEIAAPGETRCVRLCGSVAWSRPFGANPLCGLPGFGVKLTDGLGEDLRFFKSACLRMQQGETGELLKGLDEFAPASRPGVNAVEPRHPSLQTPSLF